MYYLPQPPFFVVLAGLFIAVTCGTVFQSAMEQKLRDSYQNPNGANAFKLNLSQDSALTTGYVGVCLGVWVFLGGGLLVLGFGAIPSFGVALLIMLFTAGLVWDQINDVFNQLKEGGSESLSLDDFT